MKWTPDLECQKFQGPKYLSKYFYHFLTRRQICLSPKEFISPPTIEQRFISKPQNEMFFRGLFHEQVCSIFSKVGRSLDHFAYKNIFVHHHCGLLNQI